MADQLITCPNCSQRFELSESLTAELSESIRREFDELQAQREKEMRTRETVLRQKEAELEKAQDTYEEQLSERLRTERTKIAEEEAKKAKRALSSDLDEKVKEIDALTEVLAARDKKLEEAQAAQTEYLKKQRELDDAKREMDLIVEKRIAEGLDQTRLAARKEAEDALQLKVNEKEHTISALQKQIEELKRRAEQGSQQLQGEVQELVLEDLLTARFPEDTVTPVAKGEFGGDVLQTVRGTFGQAAGVILWESKRTRNWSDGWLAKLKDDQRAAKAELAVIVSHALPKDVDTFDHIGGIWVVSPRAALPVAVSLRHSLIEIAQARKASEGQQSKMEEMYQYLTGPMFRQRVQVIAETFTRMQDDLARERKVVQKQWAKREKELERVLVATAGMYGDLQGIAGTSGIQEIEALSPSLLEDDGDNEVP